MSGDNNFHIQPDLDLSYIFAAETFWEITDRDRNDVSLKSIIPFLQKVESGYN